MVIYSIKDNISIDVPVTKESKRTFSLMSSDNINLVFSLKDAEKFEIGDYVFYNSCRYELTKVPTPEYNASTGGYNYNLTFDAEYYKWKNKIFKYTPEIGGQEAKWTLTATADKFLAIIIRNLNHLGYKHHIEGQDPQEYSFYIDASVENKAKNVSFSNVSILDALTNIAKEWDCDWWIEGSTIHFGAVEFLFSAKDEEGNYKIQPKDYVIDDNISSVSRNDTKTLATRIYPFGSTKNVPYSYRKHLMFDVHKTKDNNDVWHITDASRPLEPDWFDESDHVSSRKTYEQSGYYSEQTISRSNGSNDAWANTVRGASFYQHIDTVQGNKVGTFNFSTTKVSTQAVVTYTHENLVSRETFTKNGTIFVGDFTAQVTSVELTASIAVGGTERATAKSTVSGDSIESNGTSSTIKLPVMTAMNIGIGSDDIGKTISVTYTVSPTFGYVLDGKTKDEYIKDGYVCTSGDGNLNFQKFSKVSFVYPYKTSLTEEDFFPQIRSQVRFFRIEDHAYVQVGDDYEALINEQQTVATMSDIRLFSAPPEDAPFFNIVNLPEYKVKGWYLRSDAFLYGGDDDYVLNGIAKRNLMLPVTRDGYGYTKPYLESESGLPEEQYIEQVVVFDDVFPRTRSRVTRVASTIDYATNEDDGGSKTPVYTYYLQCGWEKFTGCDEYGNEQYEVVDSFKFDKDYILEAQTLEINFTGGKLNGMVFEVTFHEDAADLIGVDGLVHGEAAWEIVRNDTYGITLPGDVLMPGIDDTFVLTGWNSDCIKKMGLVGAAEQELLTKATLLLNDKQKDPSNYTCSLMGDNALSDIKASGSFEQAYQLGSLGNIYSDAFFGKGGYRTTHIIGWEYPLDYPYDNPKITLGETPTTSRLSTIEGKVDAIVKGGGDITVSNGNGGASVYLIKRGDRTAALDTNTFSAQRILQDFLRKNAEDVAQERITFAKGLSVGIANLGFDENGNIKANDIASRNITAQGVASPNFASGQLGSGFKIAHDVDGKSFLEIDNLLVRYAAQFTTITYNNLQFVAGNRVLSAAGGEIASVQPLYGSGTNVIAYKCYLYLTDTDGNVLARNYWALGDQARCQSEDNPKSGSGWETKGYWRRVIEVGDDYVVLSNQSGDYDAGSSVPGGGDNIVQLGNGAYKDLDGKMHAANKERQSAIMFEVIGGDAPAIKQYKGIDTFSLGGKMVTKISPSGNSFTGDFNVSTGSDTSQPVRVEITDREVFFMATADVIKPEEDDAAWDKDIENVTIDGSTPHLWKKTIYHYNDKDVVEIEYVSKSEKGKDGAIATGTVQYYTTTASESIPEAPKSDWADGAPDHIIAPTAGAIWWTELSEATKPERYNEKIKYLWRYSMTFYSVDDDTESDNPLFAANIELLSVYGQHGINGVGSLFLELSRSAGIIGLDPTTRKPLLTARTITEKITAKYGTDIANIHNLRVTYKGKLGQRTYLLEEGMSLSDIDFDIDEVSCERNGKTLDVSVRFNNDIEHDSGSIGLLTFDADVSYDDEGVSIADTISKALDISFSAGGAKGNDGEPTYSLSLLTNNLEGLMTKENRLPYNSDASVGGITFNLTASKKCQVRAMKGSLDADIANGSIEVSVDGNSIPNYNDLPASLLKNEMGYYKVEGSVITVTLQKVSANTKTYPIGDKNYVFPKTSGNVSISCSLLGNEVVVPCTISVPYTVDFAAKFGEYEQSMERFRTELTNIWSSDGFTHAMQSYIDQTADKIQIAVDDLEDDLDATGIDIKKGEITLTAGKVTFKSDDPNNQLQTLLEGGTITTNKIIARDDANILRATLNEGDDGVFRQYDHTGKLIMIIDSGVISFCDGGDIENPNIVWQLSAKQRGEIERWTDYNKRLFIVRANTVMTINNGFADGLATIDTQYRANHYYYNGGDSLQRDLAERLYTQMYADRYYWLNTVSNYVTNGYVYRSEEDRDWGAYYIVGFVIENGKPVMPGTKFFFDAGGTINSHTAGASSSISLYDHIKGITD